MSVNTERFLSGPEVWSVADLNDRTDWIQHIEPAEVDEIDAMLKAFRG